MASIAELVGIQTEQQIRSITQVSKDAGQEIIDTIKQEQVQDAQVDVMSATPATPKARRSKALPSRKSSGKPSHSGPPSKSSLRDLMHSEECSLEKLVESKTIKSINTLVVADLGNDVSMEVLGGFFVQCERQTTEVQAQILAAYNEPLGLTLDKETFRRNMMDILFHGFPELLERNAENKHTAKADKRVQAWIAKYNKAHNTLEEERNEQEEKEHDERLRQAGAPSQEVIDKFERMLVTGEPEPEQSESSEESANEKVDSKLPVPPEKTVKFSFPTFGILYQKLGELKIPVERMEELRSILVIVAKLCQVDAKKLAKAVHDADEAVILAHAKNVTPKA